MTNANGPQASIVFHDPRPSPTLASLIEGEGKWGPVSVHELLRVPGLLQQTFDLPRPAWPDFTDSVGPDGIEVVLVLAFLQSVPVEVLKSSAWHLLQHQCAGVCCLQQTMGAVRLRQKPDVEAAFVEIARKHWGTDLGRGPPRLNEVVEYRAALLKLGLDCDSTYHELKEGLYPFDASQRALDRVAFEPPNLKALTGDRWYTATLCFLAPNSD